jgi:WD40 repeat protein
MALAGLPAAAGMELLQARGVAAADPWLQQLVERYSGNPLALKLVADTVRDLFGGDVEAFLRDQVPVFEDIRDVLDEHFGRLSELGQEIMFWLAVEREAVTVETLWDDLVCPPRRGEFLALVRSLQRNSLVEEAMGDGGGEALRLGLQQVVMEYTTDRLVQGLCEELERCRIDWLHRHALVKASSPQHVQESQRRLLLQPVAGRLVARLGRAGAVERLLALPARLREESVPAPGYVGAGVLHLLLHLQVDLTGLDLSQLAIWQADLRGASLVDVDLHNADLTGSIFTDTFGAILTVAVSPDGSYLAAAGTDGVIYVWRMTDYQPLYRLRGPRHFINNALVFSGDGRFLASGGSYDGVQIWDVQTGELVRVLRRENAPIQTWAIDLQDDYLAAAGMDQTVHVWHWHRGLSQCNLHVPGLIDAIVLSPDGQLLVGAGEGATLYVWDVSRGELLHTHQAGEGRSLAAAIGANGEMLATGGQDNRIYLWNMGDMSLRQVLTGHGNWIHSLAFSPDGRYRASGSADHTARLWDVEQGQAVRIFPGHWGWVRSVAFTPDGQSLVTGGYDQTVRLWDTRTGAMRHYFQGNLRWVDFVRFSPDGQMLASTSFGGVVRLWDAQAGRLLYELKDQQAATRALAFSRDGMLLACGSDDHLARLWNTQTGALLRVFHGHRGPVRDITVDPDGRQLITGSYDDTLRIWVVATGLQRQVIADASAPIQFAMAFDPGGEWLAFGALDHSIKLLHVETGRVVGSIPMAGKIPSVVAFSPRGDLLACGTRDGAVWVWDWDGETIGAGAVDIQAPRYQGQTRQGPIWRLLFSPDSRLLVHNSEERDMHIVDVASGRQRYMVPSYYGAFCLDFSRDGQWLITVDPDDTIVIREAATGQVRHALRGHGAGVTSLTVNPEGDRIASSSADGTVRLWDLETGVCEAILEPAGPYVGMNITGVTGITAAQRATLLALGAVEDI